MSNQTLYYAFTLNNYTTEQEAKIQSFMVNYCFRGMYGREVAPTTGTKHLQGCFQLIDRKRFKTVQKNLDIKECHLEPCKKAYNANFRYCEKAGDCFYWPSREVNMIKKAVGTNSNNNKHETALMLAKNGQFDKIDAEMILKFDKKLVAEYVNNLPVENTLLDNKYGNFFQDFFILLHGPTGTGKSYAVDVFAGCLNMFWTAYCTDRKIDYQPLEVYYKKCNKWWDGYRGQQIVVIEELEPAWTRLSGNMLKQLCDQYPFPVECKGTTINKIRPLWVIMTSNYDLKTLCSKEDGTVIDENYSPLKRRIYQVNLVSRNDFVEWPKMDNLAKYFDTHASVKFYKEMAIKKQFDKIVKKRKINFQKYYATREELEEEYVSVVRDTNLEKEENTSTEAIAPESPRESLTDEDENNVVLLQRTDKDEQQQLGPDLCKICLKNECYNSEEYRCGECVSKGLVVTNYHMDKIVDEAFKVKQLEEAIEKNKNIQVNFCSFIFENLEQFQELRFYKNCVRDAKNKIIQNGVLICKLQNCNRKLTVTKNRLKDTYKRMLDIPIKEGGIFETDKAKTEMCADCLERITAINDQLSKNEEVIASMELTNNDLYLEIGCYLLRVEHLIVINNKKLKIDIEKFLEINMNNYDM